VKGFANSSKPVLRCFLRHRYFALFTWLQRLEQLANLARLTGSTGSRRLELNLPVLPSLAAVHVMGPD